nr:hypothetical protein [Gammaproteobacteria bacterium]
MSDSFTHETFFRPAEVERKQTTLPATIYNAFQLLLTRSQTQCVFVPIRSMQYQAVVDREEVIFVDSQGGYAYQDGKGGRLIRLAWRLLPAQSRTSLTEPAPCEIIFYFPGLKEEQWRLISEILPALEQLKKRQRMHNPSARGCRVIPLRSRQ